MCIGYLLFVFVAPPIQTGLTLFGNFPGGLSSANVCSASEILKLCAAVVEEQRKRAATAATNHSTDVSISRFPWVECVKLKLFNSIKVFLKRLNSLDCLPIN